MHDDPPSSPTEQALTSLFRAALESGGKAPPPEMPDWLDVPEFPYQPSRWVGRGGSGLVWRAEARDDSGPVALKVVSFHGEPRLRRRWENECEALQQVQHPHLVRLLDFGLSPDLDAGWMAMEWIEGPNLALLLAERGRLPLAQATDFLTQMIPALTALHEAGLIHRDIKPSNLLFEETSGRWILADFGLAYELSQDADARLTHTRETPATPGYAAPEREIVGAPCDARSDLYSLAFTVWEMLAGSRPLGSFPNLHTLVPLPRGIDVVLRKALANRPDDRYRDLRTFARAFERAARRPPWLRPLLFSLVMVALGLLTYRGVQAALSPPPFPREFQSGSLRVTEGRDHFMEVDLTLEESGEFHAVIRTRSEEALTGFTGRVELLFRDANGQILKTQRSNPLGVNGTLIIGAAHKRLDHWRDQVPPDLARQVERVDFHAAPGGLSQEKREGDNRRRLQKDLKKIREGTSKAWEAILRTLQDPE